MAAFRRWIFALALFALFATLASAQMTCTATTPSQPLVRNEGFTELTGDIVITCSGTLPSTVTPEAAGQNTTTTPGLQGSLTVFLNAPVTSRLLGTGITTANYSEATLLVDEPASAAVIACPISSGSGGTGGAGTNCGSQVNAVNGGPPAGSFAGGPSTSVPAATGVTGANAFSGLVNSFNNSITWTGIPVIPPGTTGATRIFRITNVRVNATGLSASSITGAQAITATVFFTSNAQGVLVNSSTTPGYATASLTTGFATTSLGLPTGSAKSLLLCQGQLFSTLNTTNVFQALTYADTFPTAFKVRSLAGQNVPGNNLVSESGYTGVPQAGFGGNFQPGLADFGTRVKAVFTGIPTNVQIWVPTTNTTAANNLTAAVAPGQAVAQLTASETGAFSIVSGTQVAGTAGATNTVVFVPLPNLNGTSTAIWEVTNATPGAPATLNFPVAVVYSSPNSLPPSSTPGSSGTINVYQSYAPTPQSLSFTATQGGAASATLPIPRFADKATTTGSAFLNINACRTVLLYPFVSSAAGFETGLGIANTSQDPFGTVAQSGTCTLNFYGSGAPSPAPVTASIAGGSVYANAVGAGLGVQNFTGYLIAVCNFQYAHGYASLFSGFGTSAGVFSSYSAAIIPDPATTTGGRPTVCGAAPANLSISITGGLVGTASNANVCQSEVLGF